MWSGCSGNVIAHRSSTPTITNGVGAGRVRVQASHEKSHFTAGPCGTRASPAPHNRPAHTRHLRDGRIVPARASRIGFDGYEWDAGRKLYEVKAA